MIVFGTGLFFFGIRALQINPFTFGVPFWLWLSILLALLVAAVAVWYARSSYPAQVRAYDQQRTKQQYLRPKRAAAGRPGAEPSPAGHGRPTGARPRKSRS